MPKGFRKAERYRSRKWGKTWKKIVRRRGGGIIWYPAPLFYFHIPVTVIFIGTIVIIVVVVVLCSRRPPKVHPSPFRTGVSFWGQTTRISSRFVLKTGLRSYKGYKAFSPKKKKQRKKTGKNIKQPLRERKIYGTFSLDHVGQPFLLFTHIGGIYCISYPVRAKSNYYHHVHQ